MERVDEKFVGWFDVVADGGFLVYRSVAPSVYRELFEVLDTGVESLVVEDMGDLYALSELGDYVYEAD